MVQLQEEASRRRPRGLRDEEALEAARPLYIVARTAQEVPQRPRDGVVAGTSLIPLQLSFLIVVAHDRVRVTNHKFPGSTVIYH